MRRMYAFTWLALACGGVGFLGALTAGSPTAPGPEASAVRVVRTAPVGQAGGGNGSGTVVASGGGVALVVTNRHVVPDASLAVEVVKGDTGYPAEVVAVSPDKDLCLLRIAADLPAAPLATADPAPGDAVRMFGFSLGGGMKPRAGHVPPGDGRREYMGGEVLLADYTTLQADSGAGVFDAAGRMVGVHWGHGKQYCNAVHLRDVRTFLAPHLKGK